MTDYTVEQLHHDARRSLDLEWVAALSEGGKKIHSSQVQKPGLAWVGYHEEFASGRVLFLGESDKAYLSSLSSQRRIESLHQVLADQTPALFLSSKSLCLPEVVALCEKKRIPLFVSLTSRVDLCEAIGAILQKGVTRQFTCHGTFVEVFNLGILLQGEPGIGKSETALRLIQRGHKLIADDLVCFRDQLENIEGRAFELTSHHLEVRGIGILRISDLYGANAVRDKKTLDLVVKLELWDDSTPKDRRDRQNLFITPLGRSVAYHVLPVSAGRDLVALLETLALHYALKKSGAQAGKELQVKLSEAIQEKGKQRVC